MARSVSPSDAKLWNSTWERLTENDWASMGEGKLLFYRAEARRPRSFGEGRMGSWCSAHRKNR
jgi:hypothetical protein